MKMTIISLAMALAMIVTISSAAPKKLEPTTAFIGATIIDATRAQPITNGVLIIKGNRIQAVGPNGTFTLPSDATVIDVRGKWIVPGLVDAHIHFFQSAGLYTRPDIVDLQSVRQYEGDQKYIQKHMEETFRRYLASGVTAVVDMGGPFWNFDVREKANKTLLAPRVAVSGPLISTIDRSILDLGDPPIIKANSPKEMKELVRKQLKKNPDLVKMWLVVLDPSKDLKTGSELLIEMVKEAHKKNVRVFVHATELETARVAIKAGADVLVHTIADKPVDKEFLDLAKSRNIIFISTLIAFEGYEEVFSKTVELTDIETRYGDPNAIATWSEFYPEGEIKTKSEDRIKKFKVYEEVGATNIKAIFDAGIPVVAGTDAGNIGTLHGPALHRELELLAKAGFSPHKILISATRDAALIFSPKPDFGTIESGKLADFLILDADPLKDVRNLRRIHRVVKGGNIFVPSEILAPNPEDVVQRQLEAYNARNLEAFLATYSEDAIIMSLPGNEVVAKGKEAMRKIYTDLFAASPNLYCKILNRTVSGNFVYDHEFVTGRRGGSPLRACALYQVENGLIKRVWFTPKEDLDMDPVKK